MSENNFKNRNEWKDILNTLEFSTFQNLVYELLCAMKYNNVILRGGGPMVEEISKPLTCIDGQMGMNLA